MLDGKEEKPAQRTTQRRSDIDGLRALAVGAIVLYHLDKTLVPGGFVGVDIFFVISGFLITGHLLSDMRRDAFSFANFYARRTKRIFPPLAVMLLLNLAVALVAFVRQSDVETVSLSTVFSIFSSSNFYYAFWVEHGYFSVETELDPLVHMWSLAVEEQFYLILPLLLYFLHRNRFFGHIIAIIIFSSFLLSEHMLSVMPMFSYYMLPARMGELLLGCAIVIYDIPRFLKGLDIPAAAMGMVLVLIPMWLYNDLSPFPGWRALPPTVGTALIIAAQNKHLDWLLSNWVIQAVGLGSYSIYLFHWPFMAYLRLERISMQGIAGIGVLIMCLNFAYVSYSCVETPIRLWKLSNRRIVVLLFLLPFALILLGSIGASQFGGSPSQMTELAAGRPTDLQNLMKIPLIPFEKEVMTAKNEWTQNLCFYSYFIVPFVDLNQCIVPSKERLGHDVTPKIMLWGDSHLFHYVGVFEEFGASRGVNMVHSAMGACPPMINVNQLYHTNPLCEGFNGFMESKVKHYEWIILAARWSFHEFKEEHINALLDRVRKANPKSKIVIVGEMAHFPEFSLKSCPDERGKEGNKCASTKDFITFDAEKLHHLRFNRVIETAAFNRAQVWYYDFNSFLCPKGKCDCYNADGINLFMDSSHFSYRGARVFGRDILKAIGGPPDIWDIVFQK